jgi:hypothetical protein
MDERRDVYRVWWRILREEDHLEDPGVEASMVLTYISGRFLAGMDWIDLAQDGKSCGPL